MKNLILSVLLITLAIVIFLELRYDIVVHSPVVAKLDRLTGDVWIANAGVWRKIEDAPKIEISHSASTPIIPRKAK